MSFYENKTINAKLKSQSFLTDKMALYECLNINIIQPQNERTKKEVLKTCVLYIRQTCAAADILLQVYCF